VLVLGTAKSGIAAARYLASVGAEVTVNDGKTPSESDQAVLASLDVKTVYGEQPLALLDGIDLMVKNPRIPYQIDLLQEALRRNIPIWTEVELAYQATDATWIAITGSNGKTTTTTLVHELLKTGSRRVHLAGNIGFPAIEIARQAKRADIIVIELASFQLLGIDQFRPYTAAFLNLSPAHLEYHGDFESYGEAKARIFKNMTSSARLILNADDASVNELGKTANVTPLPFSRRQPASAEIVNDVLKINGSSILSVKELALGAGHDVENVLAALALVEPFDLPLANVQHVLRTFGGVDHRTQFVGEIAGRKVYNDSKATNNVAAEAALSGFTANIIWLCGGLERGADLTPLLDAMKPVKHVIGLGETGHGFGTLASENGYSSPVVKTMDEAVKVAFEVSQPGDIILLSPASASWDQYKTYEERGDHFVRAVHEVGGTTV
jgi:UDP-N-acetylmuramoylalanine--D-glutamate ligase